MILSLVFVFIFSGTVACSIDNTRSYVVHQLGSHAQDTATSLGMSISPYAVQGDPPLAESMIDAIETPFGRRYRLYRDAYPVFRRPIGTAIARRNFRVLVQQAGYGNGPSLRSGAPGRNLRTASNWKLRNAG